MDGCWIVLSFTQCHFLVLFFKKQKKVAPSTFELSTFFLFLFQERTVLSLICTLMVAEFFPSTLFQDHLRSQNPESSNYGSGAFFPRKKQNRTFVLHVISFFCFSLEFLWQFFFIFHLCVKRNLCGLSASFLVWQQGLAFYVVGTLSMA